MNFGEHFLKLENKSQETTLLNSEIDHDSKRSFEKINFHRLIIFRNFNNDKISTDDKIFWGSKFWRGREITPDRIESSRTLKKQLTHFKHFSKNDHSAVYTSHDKFRKILPGSPMVLLI